jgi:hypothetical protein
MTNDDTTESSTNPSPAPSGIFGGLKAFWKRVLAVFLLVDLFGLWILAVRMINNTPAKSRWVRFSILLGSIVLTLFAFLIEHYLIPGGLLRAAKKVAVSLVVLLVALYVFWPAIEYLRGEDDLYVASIVLTDGRTLRDAKKISGTLKTLSGTAKAYRIEVSRRDYTRLKKHSYKVQLLQSQELRYKAKLIDQRAPGMPDRYVEQIIHSISSDSLLFQIRMLERYGTRVDGSAQADSAAEYIAQTMKRYGLEVQSIPFDSRDGYLFLLLIHRSALCRETFVEHSKQPVHPMPSASS